MVILGSCNLAQAMERGRQLSKASEGEYELSTLGRTVRVRMKASYGGAEFHLGETMEALFRRADEALYRAKGIEVAGGVGERS